MSQHLVVMAGGTGGHVYPGLAIARAMKARGWHVSWLGTPDGMEASLIDSNEFPFKGIAFEGIVGKGLGPKLRLPFALWRASAEAMRHFAQVKPTAVIGTGGFPSVPGGIAAWRMNIPLAIHQSDAVAGAANKLLARVAKCVMTGFKGTFATAKVASGARIERTGNPIRAEFSRVETTDTRYSARTGPLRIVVMGGSRGATVLNEVVPKALAQLAANARPSVVHQTGAKARESTEANYSSAGVDAVVVEYLDRSWETLANADLFIGRSGASTVAELAALGVASVFVPYPHHGDNQQLKNARTIEAIGGAKIIEQREFTPERLASIVSSISREDALAMALAAHREARADATDRICNCLEAMAERRVGARQ